jgi:spore coat protein CotH
VNRVTRSFAVAAARPGEGRMPRFVRRWWAAIPAVFACVAAAAAPADSPKAESAADPISQFFAADKVYELTIDLGKAEADALRREAKKYVRATLKEGDAVAGRDVGVHLKGSAGSFRGLDDKPGLTLNMDKFVAGQRFHGMDKFHLANSVQDGSYLSELICGELFRAAGVPAARIAHAVVTVNGKPRGLYYVKEGYDRAFLKKHFGTADGNLYDGGFLQDVDGPAQLISGRADVKDRADLKALVAAARERDPGVRFQKLEKLLDLDAFVSYLVLEVVTWDWDGYPLKRNNYRVYHDPKRDKIVFIPSGMDQMFHDPNGPLLPGFEGLVARALMETPEGKARYLKRAREIMTTVYRPDDLVKRLDELQARVQPALKKADPGAANGYAGQVDRLRHAIRQRAKSVDEQLKRLTK